MVEDVQFVFDNAVGQFLVLVLAFGGYFQSFHMDVSELDALAGDEKSIVS